MSNWSEFGIDAAYCINLAHRTDRWDFFLDQISNFPYPIERFDAVDGSELSVDKELEPYTGAIGCRRSHLSVYRDALAKGYDRIIVFEDDCIIKNREWGLKNFLRSVPRDWKWINAGKPLAEYPAPIDYDGEHVTAFATLNAHCYGIERSFMAKALVRDEIEPLPYGRTLHVDMLLNDIAVRNKIKCYLPHDSLYQNRDLESDNFWHWPDEPEPYIRHDESFDFNLRICVLEKGSNPILTQIQNCVIDRGTDYIDQFDWILFTDKQDIPFKRCFSRFKQIARQFNARLWIPMVEGDYGWYHTSRSLGGSCWENPDCSKVSGTLFGIHSSLLGAYDLSNPNVAVFANRARSAGYRVVMDTFLREFLTR